MTGGVVPTPLGLSQQRRGRVSGGSTPPQEELMETHTLNNPKSPCRRGGGTVSVLWRQSAGFSCVCVREWSLSGLLSFMRQEWSSFILAI